MINRADKAALLAVQKIHSLAGIYTGVYRAENLLQCQTKFNSTFNVRKKKKGKKSKSYLIQ